MRTLLPFWVLMIRILWHIFFGLVAINIDHSHDAKEITIALNLQFQKLLKMLQVSIVSLLCLEGYMALTHR